MKLMLRLFYYVMTLSFAMSMTAELLFAKAAQNVVIKGKLEAYIIDGLDGKHKLAVYLREQASQHRYELLNAKLPHSGILNGQTVSVKGKKKNASQIEVMEVAYDGSTSSSATSMGLPNSSGPQKTLVYLVNFQDKPSEQPWTPAQVQDVVFNQINSFYLENSVNRTSLVGAVAGWYTLALDSTTCDGFAIQNQARQMATAAGFTVSNYDRHVFIFPSAACGYSGMGQVGAFPSSAWIHNNITIRTIAHELGHNLGLNHSHAIDCPGTPLASSVSSCTTQEYGNTLDIMGYTGTVGHFNSYQKDRLGWLGASDIIEVASDGTYTLAPFALAGSQTRVLKIYRGIDSATGLKQWFYLEYRQPLGFDSMITDRGIVVASNAFNGVTIVLGTEGNGKSYLLDMTPDSNFVDMRDPGLLASGVFSDPVSGVSIETLSVSSNSVSVRIIRGSVQPPADSTPPAVSITSPSNGATASNSIAVTAAASDNVGVSKVEFYVDGVLKLSDASSPYSLSLDTKTLANGSHTFMAKAYDSANNSSSAQISVNVSNSVSDTIRPSVAMTSPANGAVISPRTTITLQASASDNVSVSRVEFYVNGSLICSDPTASYSCAYKLSGAKGASYLLEARAFDGAGNMAKHQISISSSGVSTGSVRSK